MPQADIYAAQRIIEQGVPLRLREPPPRVDAGIVHGDPALLARLRRRDRLHREAVAACARVRRVVRLALLLAPLPPLVAAQIAAQRGAGTVGILLGIAIGAGLAGLAAPWASVRVERLRRRARAAIARLRREPPRSRPVAPPIQLVTAAARDVDSWGRPRLRMAAQDLAGVERVRAHRDFRLGWEERVAREQLLSAARFHLALVCVACASAGLLVAWGWKAGDGDERLQLAIALVVFAGTWIGVALLRLLFLRRRWNGAVEAVQRAGPRTVPA